MRSAPSNRRGSGTRIVVDLGTGTRRRPIGTTSGGRLAAGGQDMKIKHLLGGLVLVAALGACKKGGDNADVEAFMKLDSDKAVAFAAGGTDCEAKAKSVGDWRKAHTAEYKALQKKLNEKWGKTPPKEVLDKYGDKMKENKKAVMDTMLACSNNEAFSKMMDETKTE